MTPHQRIAQEGSFFSYVAGEILSLLHPSLLSWSHGEGTMLAILAADDSYSLLLKETGLWIHNYLTTLPMKKGLSSSAAVCVLVVQSFSDFFQLNFPTELVMELAYLGEMNTPSRSDPALLQSPIQSLSLCCTCRCGRMDQCVAMGRDSIGLMEFNGSHCALHRLSTPIPIHFVVADLKASKDTVVILRDLNSCFPHPITPQQVPFHPFLPDITSC